MPVSPWNLNYLFRTFWVFSRKNKRFIFIRWFDLHNRSPVINTHTHLTLGWGADCSPLSHSGAPNSPATPHSSLFTRKHPGFTGLQSKSVAPSCVCRRGGAGGRQCIRPPNKCDLPTSTRRPAQLLWQKTLLVDVRSDTDLTKGCNNSSYSLFLSHFPEHCIQVLANVIWSLMCHFSCINW